MTINAPNGDCKATGLEGFPTEIFPTAPVASAEFLVSFLNLSYVLAQIFASLLFIDFEEFCHTHYEETNSDYQSDIWWRKISCRAQR